MNDYMKALHQRFFWELERPSLSTPRKGTGNEWHQRLRPYRGGVQGEVGPADRGDRRREKAAEAGRTGRLNKRASQGELLSEARIFPDCGWLSGQG